MSLKSSFVSGVAWTSIERFLSYFIQFVIGVVLARLLSPEEYGILGILQIFVFVSQVFVDGGFGNALIYFHDNDKRDMSTVFVFNLIVSVFLYVVLYALSNYIEVYFNIAGFASYLNVITIVILLNSLQIVPTSILKIQFKFKQLALVNTSATIIGGIIGIVMAYLGYGIWALVAQTLSKGTISSIWLMFLSKYSCSIYFYVSSFRKLFSYSMNLFAASMLTRIVDEITEFVIGKYLSPTNLGLYSRAKHFMMLPFNTIGSILFTVLYPSMSSVKEDKELFSRAYEKLLIYMAMISMPLYVFLTIESSDIILIVLGEKWKAASLILAFMCSGRIFALCAMVTENTLNAIGKADVFLKLQTIKMMLRLFVIIVLVRYGLIYLVVGESLFVVIQFFITNFFSKPYLHNGSAQQIKIYLPFMISSVVSGVATYTICLYITNLYGSLLCAFVAYFFIYIIFLFLFRQGGMIIELYSLLHKKK